MLKLALAASALAALHACGADENGGGRQLPPDRPRWSLIDDEGVTKLAFGLPDSEESALTLACRPRSGRVAVSAPLEPGSARLILVSGPRRETISGPVSPDPEAGVDRVEGSAPARDATLSAFARTGRLSRVDAGGATALSASPAERSVIRGFLNHCAR